MAGLLEFINTPAGIGLLSAVAGGMAGARRGTPINNVGRGLSAGVTGYSAANDQIKQGADNKQAQQLKQMQMDQLQQSMNQQKELQTWKAGLPRIMAPTVTGTTDQGSQLADQQAAFGQEGMQGLTESAQYADAPLNVYSGPDRRAVQEYMAQPGSPYIDDLMKQQLPKAPKWNVTERYNAQTGMPEKVLMDENNPTDVRPFGGAQADTVVADNKGGSLVYRNSRSANPISEVQQTPSPEAVMTDARSRSEGAANRSVSREANSLKAREVGILGGKQAFDAEGKMADDYKAQSKEFVAVRDGYTRLNASLKHATKSAAATLAGATSFMKLLDPGSVVRESELGMALAASGVIDRATNYHNTLLNGKVLTPSQTKDFENIGAKIYEAAEANQKSLTDQYGARAQTYGLNPKNIITDFSIKKPPAPKELPKKSVTNPKYPGFSIAK